MATTNISSNQTVTAAAGTTATYNFATGSTKATLVLDLAEGKESDITITGDIGQSYSNILKLITSSSSAIDTSDSYVYNTPVVEYLVSTNTTTINIFDSQTYQLATITISGDPFDVEDKYTQFSGTGGHVTDYETSLAKLGFSSSNGALAICYLAGSMVKTPGSLKPVEEMRAGDEVIAIENEKETPRRLIWAGSPLQCSRGVARRRSRVPSANSGIRFGVGCAI